MSSLVTDMSLEGMKTIRSQFLLAAGKASGRRCSGMRRYCRSAPVAQGIRLWLQDEILPFSTSERQFAARNLRELLVNNSPLHLVDLVESSEMEWAAVTATLLDYIVTEYGWDGVSEFLRVQTDHLFWKDVIPTVFNVDVETFEAGWNAWLAERYDLASETELDRTEENE